VPRGWYIFGGRAALHPRLVPRRLVGRHLTEILRVGVPAALSAALNYIALVVLTGTVARFGNAHLAAYGLGTRLDFLLFSLGFGVAASSMTLVGMASGAARPELVGRYVRQSALLAAGLVAVPAALVTWRPELWIGLFSSAADVLRVGSTYFRLVGPSYLFIVVSMVVATAFQGLGRAVVPLTVMIVRVIVVVGVAITLTRVWGAGDDAVFAVIAAGNIASCLALILLFRPLLRAAKP
jgi:Na+-driven multidrug efflux pump